MLHPLKVTNTLADETRYSIYEYMLQQKVYFTVTQIAEKFGIHPNVARLHLTKLAEINVISADFAKTGKGGRPGRVYKATTEGVTLSFPKREESQLLKWTMQLVDELGPDVLEKAEKISYNDGFESMQTLVSLREVKRPLSLDEKTALLTESAALIGYVPQLITEGSVTKVLFSIFNCPFQNQLATHSQLACSLHEAFLRGQMAALFNSSDMVQLESMTNKCAFCKYEISVNTEKSI